MPGTKESQEVREDEDRKKNSRVPSRVAYHFHVPVNWFATPSSSQCSEERGKNTPRLFSTVTIASLSISPRSYTLFLGVVIEQTLLCLLLHSSNNLRDTERT